ncbi:MAG: dynamin family protein [Methanomassiliicoccales archaeon]|nr:MAG: dynamin family protein [Methanomassiliicoccales archaeon]
MVWNTSGGLTMISSTALKEFEGRKLAILDVAGRLEEAATVLRADIARSRIKDIRTKLQDERFNIAVVGGYKRGKSTFVNALLGSEILPTGIVPLTSVITKIVSGDKTQVTVVFQDGRQEKIAIRDLGQYITEKGNPGNRLKVSEVEVTFDTGDLKEGVTIVDTPGIGSTFIENTKVAHGFIDQVDAAVFVIGADPPIGEAEMEFLKMVGRSVDKIFFVQNKIDAFSDGEWMESLDFSSTMIKDHLGLKEVKVYPLSSKLALDAKKRQGRAQWEASRFEQFERDFERFLVNGKGDVVLHNARSRLLRIAYDLKDAVTLEIDATEHSIEELQRRLDWLDQQNNHAVLRMKEAAYIIDGMEKDVSSSVTADIAPFIGSNKDRAVDLLKRRLDGISNDLNKEDLLNMVTSEMAITIDEVLEPFVKEQSSKVTGTFELAAIRFKKEADEIIRSVRQEVAEAFNISLCKDVRLPDFKQETRSWLDIRPVISYDLLFVGEVQSALPRKLMRRIVEKKALKMIEEELEKNAGRFRYDLVSRLSESCQRLKDEYQGNLNEVVSTIDKALRSGIEDRQRTKEDAMKRKALLRSELTILCDIVDELER